MDQAKARVGELESQISQRDQELASLRNAPATRIASQVSCPMRNVNSLPKIRNSPPEDGAGDKERLAAQPPPPAGTTVLEGSGTHGSQEQRR